MNGVVFYREPLDEGDFFYFCPLFPFLRLVVQFHAPDWWSMGNYILRVRVYGTVYHSDAFVTGSLTTQLHCA